VDVPLPDAEPPHRREVSHRIGHLGVSDELGPGGGTGGEVEQAGVIGGGGPVRLVRQWSRVRLGEVDPPVGSPGSYPDPGHLTGHQGEAGVQPGRSDRESGLAALDPISQLSLGQQGGGRDGDATDLQQGEQDLPELDGVVEHHDHVVSPPHAHRAQPGGDLVGALGQVGVGPLPGAELGVHDLDRRSVGVLPGQDVEPIQGEVEVRQLGPAEVPHNGVVIVGVIDQEVAGPPDGGGGGGGGTAVGRHRERSWAGQTNLR